MSARFLLLIFLLVGFLAAQAVADTSTTVISAGDTIRITVLGEPDQTKQVLVDSNGMIALPLVKDVHVAGMTTPEAAADIAGRLAKWIKNPDVTVELVQKVRRLVTVAGQVKNPGVYPADQDTRLMEIIGLAGGFGPEADSSKVRITRRGGESPINVNLDEFLAGKNEQANQTVREGDVILVPEKSPSLGNVFVYGSVKSPGLPIQLHDGMRVSHAVSAAGGVVPEMADLARCEIRHKDGSAPVTVDLTKALAGDQDADVLLAAGDTVTVPTQQQTGTYTILGAVNKSGEFPMKPNLTLFQAVAAAGTPAGARLNDVQLARHITGTVKLRALKADLSKVASGKAEDLTLQPGDTIYVPQQHEKFDWLRILGLGLGAAAIF